MAASQRRFAVMGKNIFLIADKLVNNQRLCRLLKYQTRTPFDINEKQPDVDGYDLLNKQISFIPKTFDGDDWKTSYLQVVYDDFVVNPFNDDFKLTTLRFNLACPIDEWILDEQSLRPFLIMQEIDTMFNNKPLGGIGNLSFYRADSLVLSPQQAGFTMRYKIDEFN